MSTQTLHPGESFGPYRIGPILGRGGMATVYCAEQTALGRRVALKVLTAELAGDERFRVRFRQEGRHIAQLEHRNILAVYDSGEVDGRLYLATPLLEGGSLADLLHAGTRLEVQEALRMLRPIAAALDYAHASGVVHRDVKPQNILIDRGGEPLLADFGIATSPSSTHDLTTVGDFLGSVGYAAPEQIRGDVVGPAADVYALAVVLYQCLSGRLPFAGSNESDVIAAHLRDQPPPLFPQLRESHALDRVLARGMAKEPGARYPTATTLVDAASLALEVSAATVIRRDTGVTPSSDPVDRAAGTVVDIRPVAPAGGGERDVSRPRRGWLVGVGMTAAAIAAAVVFVATQRGAGKPALTRASVRAAQRGLAAASQSAGGVGGRLWTGTFRNTWQGPSEISVTGRMGSAPAVTVTPDGQPDVFWRGTDGNLWESRDAGGWQQPVDLGAGPLGSGPSAGADGHGNVYVFWRGTDGSLWDKWFVGGSWHGPGRIVAPAITSLKSAPAVAVRPGGEQDVFWQGVNGDLWEIRHTESGWHAPVDHGGGPLGSAPAVGVGQNSVEYVFWRGTDGSLWTKAFVGGAWQGITKVLPASAGIASSPSVVVHPDGVRDVFWTGDDGNLWEVSYVGDWGQPVDFGAGPLGSHPAVVMTDNDGDHVYWQGLLPG